MEKSEYWREHDQGQRQSGFSVREYCEREGLNFHTFSYWRYKLSQQKPVKVNPFIRVVESKGVDANAVVSRLTFENGIRLEVFE